MLNLLVHVNIRLQKVSLLDINHYFAPDTPVDKFWLPKTCILLREFCVHKFDSEHILFPAICHYNNKLKSEAIFCCTCLLCLSQHNNFSINGNLLDLLLFNFTDLSMNHDLHELVSPDTTSFCH